MSLIKEPKGIDFIIQSQPLTDLERKEISNFIKSRKAINKIEIKQKPKKALKKENIQHI
jgi:hypothetical protein